MDDRIIKLSKLLTGYSCHVEPGENVLIEYIGGDTRPLVKQLINDVYAAGGVPFVIGRDPSIERAILMNANEEQLKAQNGWELTQMKEMDAYIAVRGSENSAELADVPAEKMSLATKMSSPVLDERVNNTKWCILRYPNSSMAQMAGTSLEAFEEYFFNVCTLDYAKMNEAMTPLKELMERTDKVEISGPGIDLTFSIKGIPAIKCSGEMNIPDGEIYTAPVRESMNGVITYNTQSLEDGFTYENIRFEIENGKIVKATANDDERINKLLDTDEGARYFGEFSFGLNPYILEPMKDTLFDEKICGSFHLTPGAAYEDAFNGNKSAVHWDLVNIQRPEYGGGEIRFDGRLIRKDGLFVPEELQGLNPENLK